MNFDVIGFPLAIVFVLVLLSWFIIKVKIKIYVKFLLITATTLVFFGVWSSITNLKGWAAEDQMPEKYQVHWVIIEEPSKMTGGGGGIFIIVTDMKKSGGKEINLYVKDNTKEPRLYKIPYSRQLHERSQQMIKGLKKGKKYYGVSKKKGKKNKKGMNYQHDIEPKFYNMPKPVLPEKEVTVEND